MNRPFGSLIGNRFVCPEKIDFEIRSTSPADLSHEFGTFLVSKDQVDDAVDEAKSALRSWKCSSLDQRKQALLSFKKAIENHKEALANAIALEVGKPLWEALGEVSGMISKITITLNQGLKEVEPIEIEELSPGVTGRCQYRALGVTAVLGPFNFPAHLPHGHWVPSLLMGNTVIFKPSEKTPYVGQVIAECIQESEFPKGVFQVLFGEKEVSQKLVTHPDVDGIFFTGSYDVGLDIKKRTLEQHWKLLALEMGGKNSTLIDRGLDLSSTVYESLSASFLTTGQRCSCTSKILVHDSEFDSFVELFVNKTKRLTIGYPLENPFMGSIIDEKAVEKYKVANDQGLKEGLDQKLSPSLVKVSKKGHYVSPIVFVAKGMTPKDIWSSSFLQGEHFSPITTILSYQNWSDAIAIANATDYGLVTSVFTTNDTRFEEAWQDLECGLVNRNRATVGASSLLPFGGTKKSGNHFPTALFATRYSSVPVASMESTEPSVPDQKITGMNWE